MAHTDPQHVLITIARILKKLNIPYLVSGGVAVLVWGRPRFTADIDIVVELQQKDVDKLMSALQDLHRAGYIDKGAIVEAIERTGEFNFIDGESGMKVDFWVMDNGEFDRSRFKRRRLKTILGEKIAITSPEDLIVMKLFWWRESRSSRHREDIDSIIAISGSSLDKKYIATMAKKFGVGAELREIGYPT